jgi:hypothetical protein
MGKPLKAALEMAEEIERETGLTRRKGAEMIEVGKRVRVTHVIEPEKWWEHAERVGQTGEVTWDTVDGLVWGVTFADGETWGFRTEELEVVP